MPCRKYGSMTFGVENRTSIEGAFLKAYSPTSRLIGQIQQFELRPRRKLNLELWEMEVDAGEDQRIDIDLGLDQMEDTP